LIVNRARRRAPNLRVFGSPDCRILVALDEAALGLLATWTLRAGALSIDPLNLLRDD
jgi:hypothetical protein